MQSFVHILHLALVSTSLLSSALGQQYWVRFSDKGPQTPTAQVLPEAVQGVLTDRALARRQRNHIVLTPADLPVAAHYLAGIAPHIGSLRATSRWLNAAWVVGADVLALQRLPYVQAVYPVPMQGAGTHVAGIAGCRAIPAAQAGSMQREHDYTRLSSLHAAGHTGCGVLVAVFDSGFRAANTNPAYDSLFMQDRIIATQDFVADEADVYEDDNHGSDVLSRMAALLPNQYVGSAPHVQLALARTEDVASETPAELMNWLLAAEWADALGADIISSSLGYNDFDGTADDLTLGDLDGEHSLIARAVDMAAARGILVVSSAGNEGNLPSWGRITTPCDADSVLCVGATNFTTAQIAGFSGRGPTADGRLKPELSVMGQAVPYINTLGAQTSGSGTSFAAPYVAGMAACLLQAAPTATGWQLRQALIQAADRTANPDNAYGHGSPNMQLALSWLQSCVALGNCTPTDRRAAAEPLLASVGPNPSTGSLRVQLAKPGPASWQLHSLQGQLLAQGQWQGAGIQLLSMALQTPGIYLLRLAQGGQLQHIRLVLQPAG